MRYPRWTLDSRAIFASWTAVVVMCFLFLTALAYHNRPPLRCNIGMHYSAKANDCIQNRRAYP